MPMYYFNLNDDETVVDTDGTDLPNVGAARIHATGVARELTSNGGGILTESWSGWTMSVRDARGTELFSLTMSDFGGSQNIKPGSERHRAVAEAPVKTGMFSARQNLRTSLQRLKRGDPAVARPEARTRLVQWGLQEPSALGGK